MTYQFYCFLSLPYFSSFLSLPCYLPLTLSFLLSSISLLISLSLYPFHHFFFQSFSLPSLALPRPALNHLFFFIIFPFPVYFFSVLCCSSFPSSFPVSFLTFISYLYSSCDNFCCLFVGLDFSISDK